GQNLLTVRAAAAPTGTTVVLALADGARAGAAVTLEPPSALPAATLPSLPELVRAAQTTGGTAQAAVAAVVPQPGTTLGRTMLFYRAALQSGDVKSWIGEPARAALTRAGRSGSLDKVAGELKQAAEEATRTGQAGEWRAQTIPLNSGTA